jgi:uroporphyrinogen decarboxylase
MQTSKELIDNLLRGREAERVGLLDSPWHDTLARWVKEGYPTDADENPVDPVDHFGFDMAGVGGWFDLMPLRAVHELVEETEEWAVHRNGAGAALKYWKHKSGTPEHIDFRMTSREVWKRDYRPHLLEVDRGRVDIKGAAEALAHRRQQGLWTHYGHLFIWENMRQSMGDMCMYESLVLDPEWIHDYNRVYTDFFKTYFRMLIEEAGKPDGVWVYEDLGYRNGLFCSPTVLEELIFPYYAELNEFFHSYDLPVVLHTCGGIEQAVPLIVEAGFDALNPMERKAGNDPLKYAEQYGDKLAFVGGLDARVFESGDRELIRREVAALIEGMKARNARFVFGSDHSISTNIAYADFAYAVDVYREHMAY